MDPRVVAMDQCHIDLIAAVAGALKPTSILEMGYGSGRLTERLFKMRHENHLSDDACLYTLVDNFVDWDGQMPEGFPIIPRTQPKRGAFAMDEEKFIEMAVKEKWRFDLIISDADHQHSHEWFPVVVCALLAPGGVAFFHDVLAPEYQLGKNIEDIKMIGYPYKVFDRNSMSSERCERGLLMVMKP